MKTREQLIEECRLYAESQMDEGWNRKNEIFVGVFYKHFLDQFYTEFAKYQKIADLVSRVFFYGAFTVETPTEAEIEKLLIEVGLWPTTEDDILKRKEYD